MTKLTHIRLQAEAVWFITYFVIVAPSIMISTNNIMFTIVSIVVGLICAYKARKWYKNKELIKLQAENKKNK